MMARILLIVVGVLAAVTLAIFSWMQSMHRGGDSMGMGDMMGASESMVGVTVPVLSGLAASGEKLFTTNCAACHGTNAAGNDGAGPPLVHIIYEPSHHGDMAFQLAVKNGVRQHHWPYGNMPPIAGVSEADTAAITAYVRTLQRANGID
ncbi:cytochrome c [Ahrensia sp. R2A130]|uniref:c-type cytochrome n=1 Tax=Ahrensia sp. R2A130 TaxID=744979 RepID=UPI0001E0E848|nr:cytochrome c [Ahrensia sp. R2A130]EFL90932.1 cytochrome c class I [Ahrensia sp. R2A130]